jgi:hypothetical protein
MRAQFTGLKDLTDAVPTSAAMTEATAAQTVGNVGGLAIQKSSCPAPVFRSRA